MLKVSISLLWVVLWYTKCVFGNESDVIVTTPLGRLKGVTLKSHEGRDIFAFRGIPYAKPPTGDRRFQPPEAYGNLGDGVFDAAQPTEKQCPQQHLFGHKFELSEMSEDCLILNVYSGSLTTPAPVMLYLHGGAYISGGSHSQYWYGPKYLLDENIVLVTMNYRLGALGFLSTGTKDATGNFAFKDQVMALKWVRDNIAAFGGDPNAVTIFGESAGGWAVSALMASPMAKGLFHKAIVMSGSSTSHFHIDNQHWTRRLANETGCGVSAEAEMVECLRQVPWEKFLEVYQTWNEFNFLFIRWNFEIEKDFGQERFLVEHPTETFARGDFHRVPIINGITKGEVDRIGFNLLKDKNVVQQLNTNFDEIAPKICIYDPKLEKSKSISKAIKKFYFADKDITEENVNALGHLVSDTLISHSAHRLVELVRKYSDIYYYRFDYLGKYKLFGDESDDVQHYDELQYLFQPNVIGPEFTKSDEEDEMRKKFVKLWTQFAQTGNPNIPNVNPTWLPCNSTSVVTMYIDKEFKLDEEPNQDRNKFWDELFPVK